MACQYNACVYAPSTKSSEREGLLVRDLDSSYLALEPHDEEGLAQVLGSSITDRIAMGPRQAYEDRLWPKAVMAK